MISEHIDNARDRKHEERICWEIVESVNSIILRWDTDLKVTFFNDYAQRFFGYHKDEILGKSLIGTIVPATSTAGRDLVSMIRNIVSHPENFVNNENENIRHDGTRVWISWTNRAIRGPEGNVTEILSVGNDITDRKRAEEALERQLKMTQVLLDAIPMPVFHKDTSGRYLGCNRAFEELFGRPRDQIIGRTAYDIAPWDVAEEYRRVDDELFRHPGKRDYESYIIDARGDRHDVVFFKATYFGDSGAPAGLIGTIIDITERKAMWQELVRMRNELEQRVIERTKELQQANESLRREMEEHRRDEEALRESEENLARAQQIAHVGIWNWDLERDVLQWSDEIYKIAGVTPDTFKSSYEAFLNIIIPEDRDRVDRAVHESIREGKHYKEEFYITTPEGGRRNVSCEGGAILGQDGKAVRMLGVCFDITERKKAEEALRESEEEFRVLVESSPAAIFFHQGSNFIYVNHAAELLTGYSRDQLLNMKFWEIIAPEYRNMIKERGMARLKGERPTARYEAKLLTGDGAERWMDLSSTLMEFRGKPSIQTTAQDVTQRRQAEEALKKAKGRAELYLDLMGHDISNMNQALMGYLEIALDTLDMKGQKELIERPLEIIRHSSRLIASVKKLELAQSGKYPMKAIDISPLLRDVAAAHASVPGRDIRISCALRDSCYVMANELLRDVFDNLVDNAIRHSSGPLEINITVDPVEEDERKYYRVSVADNGPGIPDDLKRKVFRFVDEATGSPGRRGLGLFMVRTLVESYRGRAWVEDRIPGDYRKGSRFVVLLPATDKDAKGPGGESRGPI